MSSNILGTLLSLVAGVVIEKLFGIDETTWRIGFILGSIIGLIGLLLRLKLKESPAFQQIKSRAKIQEKFITHL